MARILRRWRELTGDKHTRDHDRRTLVACSAGADSVALAVALASVPNACVLAHIRHDVRDDQSTAEDLAHVNNLARHLGVACTQARVRVRSLPGNLEANARNARYEALIGLAREHDCPFIATGHHADDQLETLLLHLMRGSGTRAMGGMRAKTQIGDRTLLRPMLSITRSEIESMLSELGVQWRHDQTNDDAGYTRNRIRHELAPLLKRLDPDIAGHASQWAQDLAEMQAIIEGLYESQLIERLRHEGRDWCWARADLRATPELLLGYLPGRYCIEILHAIGADRITRRSIESWIRAVKSESTDPTEHRIGPIVARVHAGEVRFSPPSDRDSD